MRHLTLLLLLGSILLLTACGQKGPLYLPDQGQSAQTDDSSDQ